MDVPAATQRLGLEQRQYSSSVRLKRFFLVSSRRHTVPTWCRTSTHIFRVYADNPSYVLRWCYLTQLVAVSTADNFLPCPALTGGKTHRKLAKMWLAAMDGHRPIFGKENMNPASLPVGWKRLVLCFGFPVCHSSVHLLTAHRLHTRPPAPPQCNLLLSSLPDSRSF